MKDSHSEIPPGAGSSSIDLIDVDLFFQALALKPGISVVDLGSGPGDYSIPIAKVIGREGRVYAVDLWESCIEFLKSEIKRSEIDNINPVLADMSERLPFEGKASMPASWPRSFTTSRTIKAMMQRSPR